MEAELQELLFNNYAIVMEELGTDTLVESLVEKGILTFKEADVIKACRRSATRSRKLLDKITDKSTEAMQSFMECLRIGQPSLYNTLSPGDRALDTCTTEIKEEPAAASAADDNSMQVQVGDALDLSDGNCSSKQSLRKQPSIEETLLRVHLGRKHFLVIGKNERGLLQVVVESQDYEKHPNGVQLFLSHGAVECLRDFRVIILGELEAVSSGRGSGFNEDMGGMVFAKISPPVPLLDLRKHWTLPDTDDLHPTKIGVKLFIDQVSILMEYLNLLPKLVPDFGVYGSMKRKLDEAEAVGPLAAKARKLLRGTV